jgi:hypothetical protein
MGLAVFSVACCLKGDFVKVEMELDLVAFLEASGFEGV